MFAAEILTFYTQALFAFGDPLAMEVWVVTWLLVIFAGNLFLHACTVHMHPQTRLVNTRFAEHEN